MTQPYIPLKWLLSPHCREATAMNQPVLEQTLSGLQFNLYVWAQAKDAIGSHLASLRDLLSESFEPFIREETKLSFPVALRLATESGAEQPESVFSSQEVFDRYFRTVFAELFKSATGITDAPEAFTGKLSELASRLHHANTRLNAMRDELARLREALEEEKVIRETERERLTETIRESRIRISELRDSMIARDERIVFLERNPEEAAASKQPSERKTEMPSRKKTLAKVTALLSSFHESAIELHFSLRELEKADEKTAKTVLRESWKDTFAVVSNINAVYAGRKNSKGAS